MLNSVILFIAVFSSYVTGIVRDPITWSGLALTILPENPVFNEETCPVSDLLIWGSPAAVFKIVIGFPLDWAPKTAGKEYGRLL